MKINKLKFLVTTAGVVFVVSFSLTQVHAQIIPSIKNIFSKKQVEIIIPSTSPTPVPWVMSEKIKEAKGLLKDVILEVGDNPIAYSETRYMLVNNKLAPTKKNFKEPEKQIALAVLDTVSGNIQVVTIIKRGIELIPPSGWNIDILQRPNGIVWNGWNTAYKINLPAHSVVIANVYPNETDTKVAQKQKGKTVYMTQRSIKYQLYVPYSPDLHSSDLVKSGADYTNSVIATAFNELRASGVKSNTIPNTLVSDVWGTHHDFFGRIPLLEQTDLTEFEIDPQNTVERAQVIIGSNQDQAFSVTCNSSSACGWLQFTPKTYAAIVRNYPPAKLIKDFKAGAADHLNSMKAAILLYDENLKGLIRSHGQKVLNDPRLEEYLAASYNGSPSRATKSLTASIAASIEDWVNALSSKKGGLASETLGYITKLRWLQGQRPSQVVDSSV
ncbi:MAG: hypothetical protein KBC81_01445 [Candidatus Pacebacteria bacterium]|nr:hypothetical protein [Candidatus Paceibacterota bacterium]